MGLCGQFRVIFVVVVVVVVGGDLSLDRRRFCLDIFLRPSQGLVLLVRSEENLGRQFRVIVVVVRDLDGGLCLYLKLGLVLLPGFGLVLRIHAEKGLGGQFRVIVVVVVVVDC